MKNHVSVVVLTWNARRYTEQCIRTLQSNTDYENWNLVVVDNGSTDGTVEYLRALEGVTLVENAQNMGFTHAVNQGIAASPAGADIVLVNNDLVIESASWLARLNEAAYEAADIGIVGARLMHEDGRINHLGSYMPPRKLMGHQVGGLEVDINQANGRFDIEAIIFALAYIRRDCIDQIGVLDEDFFSYFEDSEYALRAAKAGWRTRMAGDVRAVHFHNVSTKENKVDFWGMYLKSRETFRGKYGQWLEHDRYKTDVVWNSVLNVPLGYAQTSRRIVDRLHHRGVRVMYRNAYDQPKETLDDHLLNDIVERPVPELPERIINYCQADFFTKRPGKHRIGWSMLEVTGLPKEWVAGCNAMDEVWVPTQFNVETFRNSGVTVPMHVMPLGVDTSYFHPEIKGSRPTDAFTFLSIFEWGERKAPEILLQAFSDEFSAEDDAVLLLSIFSRDPSVNVAAELARYQRPGRGRIVAVINPEFASYQMGSLYRSADAFVLPTRGEGWGQPILEAMACGLPTIATNWSAQASFLNEDRGFPINLRGLIPAEARCPYYDGFSWADPDIDHLRAQMRFVYENPLEAQKRGLEAADWVAQNLTWDHTAMRVRDRLLEIG